MKFMTSRETKELKARCARSKSYMTDFDGHTLFNKSRGSHDSRASTNSRLLFLWITPTKMND